MSKNDAADDAALVKYDRRFATQFRQINTFSKVDQDLFFSMLSIIRDRKQTTVTITGDELIRRSEYLRKNTNKFTRANLVRMIDDMTDRINNCYIFMHDDARNVDRKIFLFQSFELNRDSADFTASLTPVFSHYFFNIENFTFTRFALHGFLGLKSRYSKVLYRLFLDNYGGSFEINTSDLFNLLGIGNKPSSQKQFVYRLPVYLREIVDKTGDFVGAIDYDVIKDRSHGRGGQGGKYKSLIFRYTERPGRVVESRDNLPLCPYCHKELIWRRNKQTGKSFIGHRDFIHSDCKIKGFNDINDLEQHIAAVARDQQDKSAAIAAAQHDPIYQAMFSDAKPDLPADFDPAKILNKHGNNSNK